MVDIFASVDFRSFVSEWLHSMGVPRHQLATSLGRSPSWLTMVLAGTRPLDPEFIEPVAAFLGLEGDQVTYFSALVDLESRSSRARRTAWATIHAAQAHRSATAALTPDMDLVFSRWYYGAIVELSACEGFRPDPRWISRALGGAIDESQAADALVLLIRMGQLEPDGEGGLRQALQATWTQSDIPLGRRSDAVAQLHRDHAALAGPALEKFQSNERHFSTVTMAISEAHYQVVVARLRELEAELVVLAMQDPGPANRVYQLGIQLFPVGDFTDVEDDPHSST
jgi:uncharacterized protein (TIGR02147 family)